MLQLYLNGAVGGPKDEYASGFSFLQRLLWQRQFLGREFDAQVRRKNRSSSDYNMLFDYFELITLQRKLSCSLRLEQSGRLPLDPSLVRLRFSLESSMHSSSPCPKALLGEGRLRLLPCDRIPEASP